jgi:hypothetical protein
MHGDDDSDLDRAGDAPLRAALACAPDRDLRPSPAVRAALQRAARQAVPPAPTPAPHWTRLLGTAVQRWWRAGGLLQPAALATLGSVAVGGLVLHLLWPGAEPGSLADASMPVAAAPAAAPDTTVAVAGPVPQAEGPRLPAHEPTRRRSVAAPPAATPEPASLALANAAPKAAQAESQAVRPSAMAAAPATTMAADKLADATANATGLAKLSAPAPWPAPLARLAVSGNGGDPTSPEMQAWWRGVLQATAGRWQVASPAELAGVTRVVAGPDGAGFSLHLGPDRWWLTAAGAAWQVPAPVGMAPPPGP